VKTLALLLAAVAVLAAACSDTVIVDRAVPDVVVRIRAGPRGPEASIVFRGKTQSANIGSNCWDAPGATLCIDTTSDVVVPKGYVDAPRGTRLRVDSDARSFLAVLGRLSHEESELEVVQRLEFEGGVAVIDVPPGEYTLEIEGTWTQGTVPLYFGIRVS
jgi:hypothetical protein